MPTTNYGWVTPTVGGSSGAWGTILNTALEAIDGVVKAVSDVANAALPRVGGTLTGRLNALTATMARVDKGAISGAHTLDLAAGQYFTATLTGATTLEFANEPAGAFALGVILRLTDAGTRITTWPVGTRWPSGSAPVLTTAGVDLVGLISDDNGTTWRAWVIARDLR